MTIKVFDDMFAVCKVQDYSEVNISDGMCFVANTDEEKSLVCISAKVPRNATSVDDGWRAFRIEGVLDFSLIGILAKIATLLADNNIPIFAVSTFNTDYILTKQTHFEKALSVLKNANYEIKK